MFSMSKVGAILNLSHTVLTFSFQNLRHFESDLTCADFFFPDRTCPILNLSYTVLTFSFQNLPHFESVVLHCADLFFPEPNPSWICSTLCWFFFSSRTCDILNLSHTVLTISFQNLRLFKSVSLCWLFLSRTCAIFNVSHTVLTFSCQRLMAPNCRPSGPSAACKNLDKNFSKNSRGKRCQINCWKR